MSLENQLRSSGTQKFLEEERAHAWSKALYCADRLKALRPDKGDLEQYAATMFNCTIAMGGNLDEACEVVSMTAEAWHRRHAIQIAAALPETPEDALLVLELARQLVEDFLAEPRPEPPDDGERVRGVVVSLLKPPAG